MSGRRRAAARIACIAVLAVAPVARGQGAAKAAFAQPVVTLKDVHLASTSLTGGTLDVLVTIYNPNTYDLDASQLTYSVVVDSAEVGSGATTQRVVVKARNISLVHLPVDFTWGAAGSLGRELVANGYVLYEVRGTLKIAIGSGTITVPYDQHGRFRSMQQSQ